MGSDNSSSNFPPPRPKRDPEKAPEDERENEPDKCRIIPFRKKR